MKIEDAIRQKTFRNEYHKAHINLFYTYGWLQLKIVHELKPFHLSPQQFNILRILRGMHPGPASIRELTDRMLDKSSNASRLVDKLLPKGLVTKLPSKKDSRRMDVFISPKGMEVLDEASQKVEACINDIFSVLTTSEASLFNDFLDRIRSGGEE
ncbi:MAG TPA: MarR family transcriptional regulator [Bacteroidetes bacterium]|nr:MarR family transcriptional regulator [Bacteroidota bacterium]